MPDMINPKMGIDLMNNNSIINRILFAVTIFQHSPLTRRVFYNIIRERERETISIASGKLTCHIYKSSEVFSSSSILLSTIKDMEWHHYHLHQHGLV
jgi:hypothetical protein